jgi:putative inorganic carbon (HCO3(-)) transporter
MPKEQSFLVTACNAIVKYSIYLAVFLMPIFFLPWTSDVLDFNKQALLAVLVFVAFFAWMLKSLVMGEIKLSISKVHVAVAVLFVAYLVSAILSINKYDSFWGSAQVMSQSLFSLICFIILYLLVSNNFSEKEVSKSFALLSVSAGIASLYGILQFFGVDALWFDFAKNNSFNTIGSSGSLGFFAAIMLPLFMILAMVSKSWQKILHIINIILVFTLLIILNYGFLWWVVLASMVLIIFFGIIKSNIFDGRWMFLPMFFLIISLFFIIFSPQLRFLPAKPLEISLSQKATFDINLKTAKNSPLFGTGPGTFMYDFAKYKDKNFNQSTLWNVNFTGGASKFLTDLATIGILGFLALLAVVLLPVFYVIKSFVVKDPSDNVTKVPLAFGILIILLAEVIGYFLYSTNMTLEFVLFFTIASIVVLTKDHSKTYQLKSSSLVTLTITFIFTLILIFGLGFLMLEAQRYVAEVSYYKGLRSFNEGKIQNGINYLKVAASNNTQSDVYFGQLAISSMVNLQNELSNPSKDASSAEYKKMVQQLASDAVNAANVAISLNPNSTDNWSIKGSICQNLVGLIPDAATCALGAYDKAMALNPTSPYFLLQEGNTYLAQVATLTQDQAQNKGDLLSKAKDQYNAAISLKKDYAAAYIQLALVARGQQDSSGEADALQNAIKASPNDVNVALQVGVVYYQDKNWDKAQEQFQRALAISPDYASAVYYAGLTYDQQGQKDNAISAFKKLVAANPQNKNLQKILDNLQSGKAALDGFNQSPAPATQTTPTLPATTSPEVTTPKKAN